MLPEDIMKKIFSLLLIIMAAGLLIFSEEYDIRKLKWGMSYDEIKEIEGLEDSLYKSEELLGMKVEVVFGCNNKGLYSVIYSTMNGAFGQVAEEKLNQKYGEPKLDLDYSFLVESKEILMQYPRAVVDILLKNDLTEFNRIGTSYSNVNVRKIIKGGLTKRKMWTYGNTTALLLDSPTGAILSYRPTTQHELNKKKFNEVLEELKKEAGKKKKKSEEDEKF
jgi:hypothetical protein